MFAESDPRLGPATRSNQRHEMRLRKNAALLVTAADAGRLSEDWLQQSARAIVVARGGSSRSAAGRSGCSCNCADVLGVNETPHFLRRTAVDQVTPVAEATQVHGPDVHHRLEPLELVVVNSMCWRYAPTARLIQSALRQVPHISQAKSARRGPRPAAFQLIATGPCSPMIT
jgi:hypothetical protein